jgi:hypothetical protein
MPPQTTLADETESFANQEAIASTLQRYVDGARNGDTRLLRSAFAEGARVSGSYGGKPVTWTLQESAMPSGKVDRPPTSKRASSPSNTWAPRRWLGWRPRIGAAPATLTSSS